MDAIGSRRYRGCNLAGSVGRGRPGRPWWRVGGLARGQAAGHRPDSMSEITHAAARRGIMEEVVCKKMFRHSRPRMETESAKTLPKSLPVPGRVYWKVG